MAANDVAELGGIFQNRSYFARTWPFLWRITTMYVLSIVEVSTGSARY